MRCIDLDYAGARRKPCIRRRSSRRSSFPHHKPSTGISSGPLLRRIEFRSYSIVVQEGRKSTGAEDRDAAPLQEASRWAKIPAELPGEGLAEVEIATRGAVGGESGEFDAGLAAFGQIERGI